jgi:glutamyl-tRNA synthetase
VNLIEFSHLITKPKIEEDMKVEDIVAPQSKFETPALAEIELSNLKVGDVFQFERRGFYYYDSLNNGVMNLHYIPEGKQNRVSNITSNVMYY